MERWDDAQTLRRIKKHGWTGIAVGDGTPDAWAYSVGFGNLASPEVVVCGVPQDISNGLMWEAYRQIQVGRLVLSDMLEWPLEDWKPIWRKVHESQVDEDLFNYALWYRRKLKQGGELEVYQLVFPDPETGFYPWQPGCPDVVREGQFQLYLPRSEAPPAF